jgi:hypothetical protein
LPERQELVTIDIEQSSSCIDAVSKSGIAARFPDLDLARFSIAIWGRPARLVDKLKDGDRVEILRPLAIDPRDARRRLAMAGKYMGTVAATTKGHGN